MDERLNWIVSTDDHLIEPPNLWLDRVPAKYRDQVPQTRLEDGIEHWYYDDGRQHTTVSGFVACAGLERGTYTPDGVSYSSMRPGYYDSAARVADMNEDGIIASLCFPTVARTCGQMFTMGKDKDLSLLCLQTYNNWVIDEWSGAAPGRFIPMIILPLWDVSLCVTEIERCADKGAKAISWTENPYYLGLPSLHDAGDYWDPMLQAVNDTGLVMATHFGSSSRVPETSPDAPRLISATLCPINLSFAMTDWIWCGKLQKFPNLKFTMAEGGIGWIPYILERMESVYERYKHSVDNNYRVDLMTGETSAAEARRLNIDVHPVELFRDHIFGCFIDDEFGSANIRNMGVGNVMMESDYPHSDGSFPKTRKLAAERLAAYTDDERYDIMQGNARRVFDFTPAAYPTLP
jgi:predicted TIM-barrel fold metal-dependent hydrolase